MLDKDKWGKKERVWGLEPYYDPGRAIEIYESVKDLEIKSIVDIACGVGIVLESLGWVMDANCEQFDIEEYPEWQHLIIRPTKRDLMEFIETDEKFDLVLMLNSYRNWDEEPREKLNQWMKRNAKYFITGGEYGPNETGKVIGTDVKGFKLKLYDLSL